MKISFGPVPSRRLGRSLGINNIPHKKCTYSCIYCQVGRTVNIQVERRAFFLPEEIAEDVRDRVEKAGDREESIDYLTFVPDGEPTLDMNLGRTVELLKPMKIKTAVISNASLIRLNEVREELSKIDWVSLKIDSVNERVWRRINRAHKSLSLDAIMDGMLEFKERFGGELVTETMLVRGVNDREEHVREVADFLARLKPVKAYLSIPIRPPAGRHVLPPEEEALNRAYQILKGKVDHVEYLIGYEGNDFAFTGNVSEDLLSITAVHPMREEAVSRFLAQADAEWLVINRLIDQGKLVETEYGGRKFYLRKLH